MFADCARKGYWRYLSGPWAEANPPGLEDRTRKPDYYAVGVAWHRIAELLVRGDGGSDAYKSVPPELLATLDPTWREWLLAAALAWERVKQEEFFERWEVLSVEEEFELPISPNVTLYTRADAVVRERGDGSVWVLNWKTTSDVKDWNKKWFFDPQGWTEAIAAEAKLGVPVSGSIYLGVWKGPFYQGKTTSRLIYGYKHHGRTGLTYGTESGDRERTSKFEAWKEEFPFGSGTAAWISWLPRDFLSKHFCESAPQIRQDTLVENWLKQVVKQEDTYDYVLESGEADAINAVFPQKFGDHCGKCEFRDLCLGRANPQDLMDAGLLAPRTASPRDEAAARAGGGE